MSETPERLPYEPMDERQRAINMVRSLEVTKDGDVFDLIARLLRDVDRIEWLSELRWAEIENHGSGSRIDGPGATYGAETTLREAIDDARKGLVE